MSRVPTDSNDVANWLLTEPGPTFQNTLNPGTYDLTGSGLYVPQQQSLYAGSTHGLWFPGFSTNYPSGNGTGSRNYASGANALQPSAPMSVTFWINLRDYVDTGSGDNYQFFVTKAYYTNSWSNPYITLAVYLDTAADGSWHIDVTTTAGGRSDTVIGNDRAFPRSVGYSLVGLTFDGSTLNAYLNGELVQTVTGFSSSLDYGGSGPWIVGSIPSFLSGASTKQEPCAIIQDVRIANIARPLSYYQNMYRLGALSF